MNLKTMAFAFFTSFASAAQTVFPLEPPRTASVAESYASFVEHSGLAYTLNQSGKELEAKEQKDRAMECLDLSEIRAGHSYFGSPDMELGLKATINEGSQPRSCSTRFIFD
jgi:hypothetical protein